MIKFLKKILPKLPEMTSYNYAGIPVYNQRNQINIPMNDEVKIEANGKILTVQQFKNTGSQSQTFEANRIDNRMASNNTCLDDHLNENDYHRMKFSRPRLTNETLAADLKRLKARGYTVHQSAESTGYSRDTVKKYYACFSPIE